MSDDIVTRLRDSNGMTTCRSSDGFLSIIPDTELMREAADEIERLRDERDDWLNAAAAYKMGWVSRGNKIYDRLVNGMKNHE